MKRSTVKFLPKAAALTAAASIAVMGGAGVASANNSAHAAGVAKGSPGVLSGNVVQVPIAIPINVCGNSANVVGAGNAAFGNRCINA
ncbi:chaplin [Streptomyces sp. NPDC048506]|uniref:chaplin n=1 Tax=Streptomyces sp. NPDC048506 TaxID=3155028 RepID=UPI00342E80B8